MSEVAECPNAFVAASGQKAAEGMVLLRRPSLAVPSKLSYAPGAQAQAERQLVCLTVRTLDKKEHQMSVANDIPVLQLKKEVANITCIDAESQRLVSGGEEMSLDLRLSDYCSANSHVIYLVVKFPSGSYGEVLTTDGTEIEEVEVEPATSTAVAEVSTRSNPRIVLRGTVTIPVPERDVHRVVNSLMGSQTNLSDFVSSMTYNQSGQSWNKGRRAGGAARPRIQRGRQAQGRRGQAARAGGHRGGGQRNSVNVSFRGSEWESMRVWPQSIDFQAGFGDDFLYDSLEEPHSDGFRLHYSSAHRGTSRTLSDDEESGAGRDDSLASLLECDDHGNHDLDDSYLSGNQTMLAEDGRSGDGYYDSVFDGINYSGGTMEDEEEWDEPERECYDAHRLSHNELPLGRIAGKRKYAEMCNIPAIPHRSAPRSRSMGPDLPGDVRVPEPGEPGYSQVGQTSAGGAGRDECQANEDCDDRESDSSHHPAFMCSPNISISLGPQHGGALPDNAEVVSRVTAVESDDASRGMHDVRSVPVCHFELPPNRGAPNRGEEDEVVLPTTAGDVEHPSVYNTRAANRDRVVDEIQGSQRASQQAAKASGDPLAAAEMHCIDSDMTSLCLSTQLRDSVTDDRNLPSPRPVQVIDASKSGRAVYKTNPEPLVVEVETDASLDAPSPGSASVWSQRNSLDRLDRPVKKNQCCIVM